MTDRGAVMTDPLEGTAWREAGTVAGFARSLPNAALMDFAQAELARLGGAGHALDLGCRRSSMKVSSANIGVALALRVNRFRCSDTSRIPCVRCAAGVWVGHRDRDPDNRHRHGNQPSWIIAAIAAGAAAAVLVSRAPLAELVTVGARTRVSGSPWPSCAAPLPLRQWRWQHTGLSGWIPGSCCEGTDCQFGVLRRAEKKAARG